MVRKTISSTYLFSRGNANVLPLLAASNVLLGFDYDAALAPAVSDLDRAAVRMSTRRLLRRVSELYPCVVVSGRSRSDLTRRLRGVNAMFLSAPDPPRKGLALEQFRIDFGCDSVLYLGDDAADEDVFGRSRDGRLLRIRIGRARAKAAACHVRTQSEVDRLLETLIALRAS